MAQPLQPLSEASGWTRLARGEQYHDAINRCPAGHVHLDYGNVTIRFERDEFLVFAQMVTEAADRLTGRTRQSTPPPQAAAPSSNYSLN
jgi:hypothetical protein